MSRSLAASHAVDEPAVPPPADGDVSTLARLIAASGARSRAGIYHLSWWSDRVIRWAMSHQEFKTQLFRLVDTFPAIGDDEDAVSDYLDQYFDGVEVPRLVDIGLALSERFPGGHHLSALVTRSNIERMARQFIIGETQEVAAHKVAQLWREGFAATVDLLGEHTVSDAEADAYAARVRSMIETLLVGSSRNWPADDHLERLTLVDGSSIRLPRVSVSVKVSALTTAFGPLTADRAVDEAMARLVPLAGILAEGTVSLFLDVESYETKDLVHALMARLAADPRFVTAHLGTVVQAYLKDSIDDLDKIIALSSARALPLSVRLVKGAYWDTETIIAAACGWPNVVYESKEQTDANYERCTLRLLSHLGEVRSAFATHNLRSLSFAIAAARAAGIPDGAYEMQVLFGMAEPVAEALRVQGIRVRTYAPVGALVPGMSYLVRRLLENTSNESFVRHRYGEGMRIDALLAPPKARTLPPMPTVAVPATSDPRSPLTFEPEPPAEWRRATVRAAMAAAVAAAPARFGQHVHALIDGQTVTTGSTFESVDPSDPDTVVAVATLSGPSEVAGAVSVARHALGAWRRWSAADRAGILFRSAAWMRARRFEIAAMECFEVGKPWADADADVCEAIDYCEFYGREAIRLAEGGTVGSPPGEQNRLVYEPRGVVAVIAPWNFPLAIPTGMVTAALAVGNTVVLKPAEQSPATARFLVDSLLAAGLPPGALGFLPGTGDSAGAALVDNPEVDMIAFTGSRDVGLAINAHAARPNPGKRSVTRVVAEMGGKNAVVVAADADLDEAVIAIIRSAFGFSGQKCSAASRCIVEDRVYDRLADRLVGAAQSLSIGHPRHCATQMGPLVEADAVARAGSYLGDPGGEILLRVEQVPDRGFFMGPVVVGEVDPDSPLAREEIFAPVLALFRVPDVDRAIALANRTDYGLTGGIFSRSPRTIARAVAEMRVGNVYVNRAITGAVVGRQPFGGSGLSGVGSKAGGPDYLIQFSNPKAVSENTLRHGFAPLGPESSRAD